MRPERFNQIRDELTTADSHAGKDVIHYRNMALELSWHVEAIQTENERLRKALEHYATEHWACEIAREALGRGNKNERQT